MLGLSCVRTLWSLHGSLVITLLYGLSSPRRQRVREADVAAAACVAAAGIAAHVWSVFVDRALAVQGEKQKEQSKKKSRKEQSNKRSRKA